MILCLTYYTNTCPKYIWIQQCIDIHIICLHPHLDPHSAPEYRIRNTNWNNARCTLIPITIYVIWQPKRHSFSFFFLNKFFEMCHAQQSKLLDTRELTKCVGHTYHLAVGFLLSNGSRTNIKPFRGGLTHLWIIFDPNATHYS